MKIVMWLTYIIEHLQVCWHTELLVSAAWGGGAFRNNEGRPLHCICQGRCEEQRQGWQWTWGFCVVLRQWRPCATGFSGRSSSLWCIFIILWENIKLICFPCLLNSGAKHNLRGSESVQQQPLPHILIPYFFWHVMSSNTYIMKLHHEKILFLHFLSSRIVHGLLVTGIWMFSGILGWIILLIVCCIIYQLRCVSVSSRGEKKIMLRVSSSFTSYNFL